MTSTGHMHGVIKIIAEEKEMPETNLPKIGYFN